ncbi:Hypothetical protein F387_01982 [Wohlfahrtiimonas chitiniclastica SH04]|uniref:Uncharacterized protein n=1 Tax=Wohlfahrtiimonas chitiniclastica SH04 TaxID=1261130 RepID=L8XWL4_9GAMM|nr:hypothetical protein [Wohlfahrtiimonas chitiniclastica]ELV07199.1 Hypothetical protein F387_01982 [Wohlfahrtiimonas chitiniclastica SH04]
MFKKILCFLPLFCSLAFAQKVPTEWINEEYGLRSEQEQDAIAYAAIKASLNVTNCHLDIIKTIKTEDEFLVVWNGNACGGGNGTETIDIAGASGGTIKNSFFDLSNFINTRFLSDIQIISKDEYVITSSDFDENDLNNFPSIEVKTRITRNKADDIFPSKWRIEEIFRKKNNNQENILLNDGPNEIIAAYEIYNSISSILSLDDSQIKGILKKERTPYLLVVKNNEGYKIMSFDPETLLLNKDYFNYKYNNLYDLQSFKIINPGNFEFTIFDENNSEILITYSISINENSQWKTTELTREEISQQF